MDDLTNGGPAFPHDELNASGEGVWHQHMGMSLRDYFAATIDIPWEHARRVAMDSFGQRPTVQQVYDCRAAMRYAEADAMLAARLHQSKEPRND